MIFRYAPPAPEEWRALWIQAGGSCALLAAACFTPLLRTNPPVLAGVTLGILYLVAQTAVTLWRKTRRARSFTIELRPTALVLHDGPDETIIPWTTIQRCEPQGTDIRVTWREPQSERTWAFAPRTIIDGQTLAREIKQRSIPNFIALDAK